MVPFSCVANPSLALTEPEAPGEKYSKLSVTVSLSAISNPPICRFGLSKPETVPLLNTALPSQTMFFSDPLPIPTNA